MTAQSIPRYSESSVPVSQALCRAFFKSQFYCVSDHIPTIVTGGNIASSVVMAVYQY